MAWYSQTSPGDSHDWDSTEAPVFADAPFNGKMRKLVMTAQRNGYFFVLDRVTGEHLVTGKMGLVNNRAKDLDGQGHPRRDPLKDATIAGSIVNADVANHYSPAFSPDTGLFYRPENNPLRIMYLMDPDPRGSMGLGGTTSGAFLPYGSFIEAIEYKTGNIVWRNEVGGTAGLLATAGRLLFSGDGQNLVAYEPGTSKPLWHTRIGPAGNGAEIYMLDGHQYLLATAGDQLFAFRLNE